jgi:copper chaperone CopZ
MVFDRLVQGVRGLVISIAAVSPPLLREYSDRCKAFLLPSVSDAFRESHYDILPDLYNRWGADMNTVLQVQGMKCGGCESLLTGALEALDGVNGAKADHKLNQIEIDFDPSLISIEKVKETIASRGYEVKE